MQRSAPDHYATLGLNRNCTAAEIRDAWRTLAKECHPDANGNSAQAGARTRAINDAYEILGDPARRREYDRVTRPGGRRVASSVGGSISQDTHLRLRDFFLGTTLEISVNDPGSADGLESYSLTIPPGTMLGARFRISRDNAGGAVTVRVKARPDSRFKVRGSNLRCDLRITARLAGQGGNEAVAGPTGNRLRVQIPRGVARGEEIAIPGEGLPKRDGGRGDLLVRVLYTPDVRITRR